MTNEQILKKAIEKAFGFTYDEEKLLDKNWYYTVIFSHSFCRAIWGEKPIMICEWGKKESKDSWGGEFPLWIYHLFQMVKEEKPLKYLEKYL